MFYDSGSHSLEKQQKPTKKRLQNILSATGKFLYIIMFFVFLFNPNFV